jgi:hypothetical protein
MLVDIIASLLESTSKYKMTLGNLGAQPLPFKLRGKAETAEASGRFSRFVPDDERDFLEPSEVHELKRQGAAARQARLRKRSSEGQPKDLPPVLRAALEKSLQGQLIKPLPMNVLTLNAASRGAARSVTNEKTRDWLDSAAGLEWRKERATLFGADDASTDVAACPLDEAACPLDEAACPLSGKAFSSKGPEVSKGAQVAGAGHKRIKRGR